ncbi:3-deoxy-7-phosphoheptulonate synthase (plasmid) [Streptomyces goshikiensis]|uniref:Phospho-2-dehydro-3-deoxyheptonate aldolase n=1 Tax=Streptomyces goshikiensis TaxID=1942 RepID=A0ABZ1RX92_9ACTN|nr:MULTISPECIES: 3-deoxy-7-phosphoheptulonate synthase [Streptomyces]EDX23507.1 phospho-2-dehydro-3-deoxyheptonate aldolase [Streptomyces sp. Mg1]MBT1188902.1 3-deoxy-7-phosphoheptulonate synthase [Streptomyces sp. CJ_13]PJN17628.1 phospho-2-dehydro-3-deoxyheptonate aldolase [Streptomyces sp. CB02120-2]RPK28864.1 Phospho-2-dehydro-3-deoxyheptonate aldolase [Streptomyces sp. ADI91-18]WBY24661.1 3-deoxy-7-phosphoheptulonate synthase [Streptomyces goshikiensis]
MTFADYLPAVPVPAGLPLPTTEWRNLPADQQPTWPDPSKAAHVQDQLALAPALTAAADVRRLGSALTHVAAGRAFLLQAGDCAEPVGAAGLAAVRGKHRVIGEMAEIISGAGDLPTVTVGRIAGQYAKPRSKPEETVGDQVLPVYRGDMVNESAPEAAARIPDPYRMLTAYGTARAVLNELHLMAHESASAIHPWDARGGEGRQILPTRTWDGSLRSVLKEYGQTSKLGGTWRRTGLWTSHEALVLDYEQSLVRRDSHTGEHYLLSTHLPWIGERTRRLDGAHVAFLAQVANPVACKVGPGTSPEALVELCARLDRHRRPGRLTLIGRFGAGRVREVLPGLVKAVRAAGHDVAWVCDPMHGNTITTPGGLKARRMGDIHDEITGFFEVLFGADQWPGGVHLEIAGDRVTECLGAGGPKDEAGLRRAYRTLCDPRLNDDQALLTARTVSELISRG